ncbi:MAG: hypothetical protein MSA90_02995 [Faecalicatena sp.]|uniref:hypothetical protein n=1 Tax=Faecalicatena sp. TaxID=2005360 RepID=UPI002587B2BA|nr:hypothetical protein [Faecalicatena sp.]MCI6464424.1 hypothetical protein [Faecalicatena sp.]MDY5620162.1 hypothetical protein [Lachnospiraceae bacterium]
MKKVMKGNPGYLEYKKKVEIIRTVIYFALVAAIFFLGYSQTHSKKNLLTIVAVVGCLPASKALVGVITRFPYPSIATIRAEEIQSKTSHITVIYDMIVTSREKVMPINCIVLSGNTIFGYTDSEKVDLKYAATHIRGILNQNQFPDASVKILNNYTAFLARAEGLDSIAAVEKNDTRNLEEKMARVILNISM